MLAVVQVLVPVHLRLMALANRHRLSVVGLILLDFILQPPYSKLGRPSEPLCALGALLTGELIGFIFDVHARRARHVAATRTRLAPTLG